MTDQTHTQVNEGQDWQRLSPWSILHFVFKQLRELISSGIYALPVFAVGLNKWLESTEILYAIVGGLVVFILLGGFVRYWTFLFLLHDNRIEIKTGLLERKYTDLPFERIQNVKIDQPIYYRWLQLVIITLDTAGSAKEEAAIVAVSLDYAERLKQHVMQCKLRGAADDTNEESSVEPSNTNVLNTRSVADLVLHGITNNRVWILVGAAAPFYDDVYGVVFGWIEDMQPQVEQMLGTGSSQFWYLSVVGVLFAVVLMASLALLSIAGSIFVFYGYTLLKEGDRYIRRSGLVNKQEVGMKQSRVQMVRMKQDWLDVLLKRINLYLEQNVTGNNVETNELKANNKLLVPSVTPTEANSISADVFPHHNIRGIEYSPISPRYLIHVLCLRLLPLYILALTLAIGAHSIVGSLVGVAILGLAVGGAYIRWKRWGVAFDANYIYIRRGLLGVDYECFPYEKIQQVRFKQSVFMRNKALASPHFILASGKARVPFLPQETANHILNKGLHRVESEKPKWM